MVATLASCVATAATPLARAQPRPRPLFEPTDLELEPAGLLDVDVQFGLLRTGGPWRAVVPDVEIDLGLAPGVEIDLDAAYAVEGSAADPFSFREPAPDNVWLAAKVGLLDVRDPAAKSAWALGAQFGPKFPTARSARGAGYEALALVGRAVGRTHLVLNAGGLVDPGERVAAGRPVGIEAGIAADVEAVPRWSAVGQLGGMRFLSDHEHQLHAAAGARWAALDALDLSLLGLAGLLPGGDRFGVLVGVSPKFALWR